MKASVVWAFAALCAASVEAGSTTQRVLFIGNSYTYVNDLPNLYKQLATSLLPGVNVTVDSDTGPGRRLEEAAQSVPVQERLAAGNFDFLVLQDAAELGGVPIVGSYESADLEKARLASEAAIRDVFTPAANKAGATVVFFVTWAQRNRKAGSWERFGETGFLSMQRWLSDGYAAFADIAEREACGRVVQARAGEVYKKVYEFSRQTTALPSDDSFSLFYQLYWSANTAGSYATAWALFTAITGNAAPYKAGSTFRSSLSEELAAQLAGMAQEVWTEHASVASEIKAIQGYYPTSTYVVHGPKGLKLMGSFVVSGNKLSLCRSLWGGADPNYEGDVYDLTVQDGAVHWHRGFVSVTSVSEFAATVEWTYGVVFTNPKAVCRGPEGSTLAPPVTASPTASPPTPTPPTASPPTPAPPTATPPTPAPTASPATSAPPTSAPPTASPPTPAPTESPPTHTLTASLTTSAPTAIPHAAATSAPLTASPGTLTLAPLRGGQDSSDSDSDKTWIVVLVVVVAVVALGGVAAFFFLQKKKASPKFSTRDVVEDLQKTPFPAAQPTEMADHYAVPPASLPCDPRFL